MTLVIFIFSLLVDIFVGYSHFILGLTNSLTDFLASMPNIFFSLFYFFTIPLISWLKLEYQKIFQIKNLILAVTYLYIYLFSSSNTIIIKRHPLIYTKNNTKIDKIILCSQNTKHAQALTKIEFWQTLRLYKCNLIILQEVHNSNQYKKIIGEYIKRYLHSDFYLVAEGEFVILSELPIENPIIAPSQGFLSIQINQGAKRINLINTHIWTPLEKQSPKYNPNITKPLPAYIVRKKQISDLLNYLNYLSNSPTILIGDFNMLPTHPFLTTTLRKYGFVRIKNKKMICPTYSTSIPIIEIDHIFTNTPNLIKNRYTVLNQFSDHAMQVIEIY